MGTWGDGLYDNDDALDVLAELTAIGEPDDAATLAARIGLAAWLDPSGITCAVDRLRAAVAARADGHAGLPADARAAVNALLADPEGMTRDGSREAAVAAALGGYCDGPRLDALLRLPAARPAIDGLAEAAARAVDRALAPSSGGLADVARGLAALGPIVELTRARLWRPTAARVAAWRAGLAAADARTREDRRFWDGYAARVRRALDLVDG